MGAFSKTTKVVELDYKGHQIEVKNWWRAFPMQSEASLSVDGTILATNQKFSHPNPDKPIFQVLDVSDSIQSIDVFMIGVFEIKFAVSVNGENIYREDISYADMLQRKYLGDNESA